MPPRKRLKARATSTKTRKGGRRRKQDDDEIPQIFQEMLMEAVMSSPREELSTTGPVKRRRTSAEQSTSEPSAPPSDSQVLAEVPDLSLAPPQSSERLQQIVYEEFGSSEDDSDVDFEDVTIENDDSEESKGPPEQKLLQLDLSTRTPPRPTIQRRKPVSKAERDYRLNLHKIHLLFLLMNLQLRRRWCEIEDIQAILKPLISSKLRNMLHVSDDKPDYQRSHSFNKAIEEICALWREEFKITRPGMRSAFWKEDIDAVRDIDKFEDPSSYQEFREAAGARHGSRDLGTILFCTLLRSAAVEVRLVCSLQVLPFSAVAKGPTPEKSKPEYAYRSAWANQEMSVTSYEDPSNARWRQSGYAGAAAPVPQIRSTKRKIHDSQYPIFWVEVMLPTTYTWIPLDPLVRKTINKPKTGFEPPLSDQLNSMSYVVAFEDTGYAKDVTRRYTQFFNAKTRKQRIESTKNGDYWWSVTMQWFRRFKPIRSLGDVLEDKELNRKSESEPMPKNISDFKGHPVFALERHLRRNEVIWPDEHRGHISAGNKDGKSEKVYHRKNVHIVRSADQWYRKGRDLKIGEQPLKRVATQKRRGISIDEDEVDGNQDGTPLYAEFQTDLYVPPPVVKGRIPKNQYGNLDVYVSSMIPPGAIHLQHPEARNAAQILGVDFTDAVTGFKFKGRQGTAVVNGIVAAAEYRDALVEVVEGLEYERVREQEEKQSMIALSMWKKFMAALRIRQRINDEHAEHDDYTDVEQDAANPADSDSGDEDSTYNESEDAVGGGFVPEPDENVGDGADFDAVDLAKLTLDPQQTVYHEVVVVESPHTISQKCSSRNGYDIPKSVPSLLPKDSLFDDGDDALDDLFNGNNDGEPGGFAQEDSEDVGGGGFMVDDDASADGGGFIPEEDEDLEGGGLVMDENPAIKLKVNPANSRHPSIEPNMNPQKEHEREIDVTPLLVENHPSSVHQVSAVTESSQKHTSQAENEDGREVEDNDAGSLLSHDPEDDDAEEEWVIDIDE